MERYKYPRTYHLPWTEEVSKDDKVLASADHFRGREVVVTEKLDGENTTIYPDGFLHARSLDSVDQPTQHLAKNIAASVGYLLPPGTRLLAEDLYAIHSIAYGAVHPLVVFGAVRDGYFLSWDDTEALGRNLGLATAPVLWRGTWDEASVRACQTGASFYGGPQEGYVVRMAGSFPESEFGNNVAKFVRHGHVQNDRHWRYAPIRRNALL